MKTALVIDDNVMIVEELMDALKDEFERVVCAYSAKEGIKKLRQHKVDMIISDFEMPGGDGLSVFSFIKEEQMNIPFILFTGRGREEEFPEDITVVYEKSFRELLKVIKKF